MKFKIHLIAEEFFQYSLIAYLLLLLAETLKKGFVSFFFNLNFLLIIVLLNGILMILTHDKQKKTPSLSRKIHYIDIAYIFLLAIGGALLVYSEMQPLREISLLVAGITAVIIFLLSLLLLTDHS